MIAIKLLDATDEQLDKHYNQTHIKEFENNPFIDEYEKWLFDNGYTITDEQLKAIDEFWKKVETYPEFVHYSCGYVKVSKPEEPQDKSIARRDKMKKNLLNLNKKR